MSFNTTGNRISYNGNDITTAFSFPYLFYNSSHLKVILVSALGVETVQTITTHYTVAGVGASAGGTVTMLTPPATGEKLVILRVVPYNQGLLLVENDPFPSQSVMERLDLNVMMAQQLAGDIGRSMTVSEAEDSIASIPTVAERAGKYAAYDSLGNPIASTGAAGTIAVSTFMEAALGATSAAALITATELDDEPAWVTFDMMADLAQGSVIVGGASDRPAALALGDGEIAIGDGTDVTAAALEADIVPYDNSTSGLVATDVRAAIDEIVRGGLLSNREEKSLSGTAVDFTSAPVWARRVTLLFSGVKRSAETALYIQIGDSGGVETTGYAGARFRGASSNTGTSAASDGFQNIAAVDNAINEYAGAITLWLIAGTTWVASGAMGSGAGVLTTTAGGVTLDSALTTVRITADGSATLTGEVTVVYE